VLVAGPDPGIRRLLRRHFGNAGYNVMTADLGRAMLDQLRRSTPDIIILSAEMGDLEGVDLVSRVHAVTGTPLLVLRPAKGSVTQQAILDAGAEDCLDEPFLLEELAARARRLLCRAGVDLGPRMSMTGLGKLAINWLDRSVSLGGWPLELTRQEFDVLAVLAKANGATVGHEEILSAVWGDSDDSVRQYLRRVVGSLRRKIEPKPKRPAVLVSVRGSGYRLNVRQELGELRRLRFSGQSGELRADRSKRRE
jgi:two-component system, OmpR family, KDP operon response regulator KdpE